MMWEGSFSGGGARGLCAVARQWTQRCVHAGLWCRPARAFGVRMAADPITGLYFTIIFLFYFWLFPLYHVQRVAQLCLRALCAVELWRHVFVQLRLI
jgi:hypothetical protein